MHSTATQGIQNPEMVIDVTTFNGNPQSVRMPHGQVTVAEVLAAAGVQCDGRELRVSGQLADLNSPVREGDRVELHPMAENG